MAAKKKQLSQEPVKLTPIQLAHKKRQENKDAGIEVVHKNPYERWQAKPTSRALACSAKCFDCVGHGCEVGWRDKIRTCASKMCPLHPFRPYQRDSNDDEIEDIESV